MIDVTELGIRGKDEMADESLPQDVDDESPRTRGKAAKERAKELRKAVDQRRMNREGQRQQKREERLKLQETAVTPYSARGSARSSRAESEDGSDVATPKSARDRSARSSLTMSDDASPPTMPDAIGWTHPSLVEAIPMDLCLHLLSSLGALELSACACTCHKLESAIETDRLWGRLHDRVYGASSVPSATGLDAAGMESTITATFSKANEIHGAGVTDPAAALRHRLLVSSRALELLRKARACPLPLPGMVALCLDGEMLVSAHQGQLLRLTHVATGRRLACRKLKHAPVCCHAANGYAAVADVTGAVHTFHADDGFATQLGAPLETAQFGSGALSVAVLAGREAVGGSAILAVRRGQGVVTVHELPSPEAASPLRFPELRFALTLEGEEGDEEGGETAHVHPSLATSACNPSALYTVSRGGAARIDVEAERVVWSAPACAHLDWISAGTVHATATAMANLEEQTNLEEQLSSFGLGEQPLRDASRRALVPHHELGHPVHASYSAGWRLLAGVSATSCVVLWDERVEGRQGPVAWLRLPFAGAPRCVQLEEASEGISTAAGHLLVSPRSGGSILVYDIRRLGAQPGRRLPSPPVLCPPPTSVLPPPICLHPMCCMEVPDCGSIGSCFAADERHVVAGGGPKGSEAFSWRICQGSSAASRAGEDESDGESEASGSTSSERKSKPKRQPKERKRLPCRLANR